MPEVIDNCQHILLRCCVNLVDFYRRLGVERSIEFHKELYFLEPGGRMSKMAAGWLPAPLHFTGSFAVLKFLTLPDRISVARALLALRSEYGKRQGLDAMTMLAWLKEKQQTPRAIERFWRQVLVSAINEELDRMAASHGFQVFWLGFLAKANSYEMGVPAVPLGDLYGEEAWRRVPSVRMVTRTPVERIVVSGECVSGVETASGMRTADWYVSAVPFERIDGLLPELELDLSAFEHSPITGIHLWFDRPVTALPHGTLLDRNIQWFFNKGGGRYLMLVVSASREMVGMTRQHVLDLALRELREFLPAARDAKVEKAHVVKEVRATFSAKPGLEAQRPPSKTRFRNFFLAGDWTRSGWPATMEGAVRSGYLAAEAVTKAMGSGERYLLPDIA